jgi:hypothetical protein
MDGGVLHSQASSTYVELFHDDVDFWIRNTLSYNQMVYQNDGFYVKNLALPCDGRILGKDSLQILLE